MDQFSRTLLPAAAESGIRSTVLTRHMPLFRRCVDNSDTVVLATQCYRPEVSPVSDYLFLLTGRRLVVTRQSRLSGRVRVHLDVSLAELDDVVWRASDRRASIEFAATIGDGRHRFLINQIAAAQESWQTDARFNPLLKPVPVPA